VRYYQRDGLGSVTALTDNTGAIKSTYKYEPFGAATVVGESSDNPFQYTGRENDGTGLYYYRARYYSSELQRFISEDPIKFKGGINFYAYVGNSSVNRIDPMGLDDATSGSGPSSYPGNAGTSGSLNNLTGFYQFNLGDDTGQIWSFKRVCVKWCTPEPASCHGPAPQSQCCEWKTVFYMY